MARRVRAKGRPQRGPRVFAKEGEGFEKPVERNSLILRIGDGKLSTATRQVQRVRRNKTPR